MPVHEDARNAEPHTEEPHTDSEDANGHRGACPGDETERRFKFPEWFREIGRWRSHLTR